MVFDKSCGAQLKNHDIHTAQPWFGQFVRCKGNLDVWMRPTVESNGEKYWEYFLCYVDDILCIVLAWATCYDGLYLVPN